MLFVKSKKQDDNLDVEDKRIYSLYKIVKTILSCRERKKVCGVEQDYKAYRLQGLEIVNKMIDNYTAQFNVKSKEQLRETLLMLYFTNLEYSIDEIRTIFSEEKDVA